MKKYIVSKKIAVLIFMQIPVQCETIARFVLFLSFYGKNQEKENRFKSFSFHVKIISIIQSMKQEYEVCE
jgi:hypothetical protein